MQKTASFGPTVQPNISKAMQSQPTQNMFVQPTVSNTSSQVHTNSGGNLYRGPSASPAPRNGARHVPMQAMYPQAMHQSVVVQPFPQYQRQAFPAPPYAQYPQPLQPNYPYTYPYYPVPTQRGAVGVSTGVGVGSTMTVQQGPNGPMSGPPGATQTQIPLAPGTVLTASAVPPGTNPTVLGVAPNPNGQQVAVQSIVGVVQTTVPTQPSQKSTRRRTHAIKIIDPSTNKDIFEDYDGTKTSSCADNEYPEQNNVYAPQPIVMTEQLRSIPYDMMDMPQMSRDGNLNQTPIVSAISDGPSVEILPSVQKPRGKKILPIINPKDGNSVHATESQSSDTLLPSRSLPQHVQYQPQQSTSHVEEVVPAKSDCVQQQLPFLQTHPQQSHHIVSQSNTKEQPEQGITADANVVNTDQIISHECKAGAADGKPISNLSLTTAVNSSISVPSTTVALEASQYPLSTEFQHQPKHFISNEVGVLEKPETVNTLNSTGSSAPEISTNLDGTHLQATDILPQSMQLTQETPDVVNEKNNISNVDSGTDQSTESNHVESELTEKSSNEPQNARDWEDDAKVAYTTSLSKSTAASSVTKDEEAQARVHAETAANECDETDRAVQQRQNDSMQVGVKSVENSESGDIALTKNVGKLTTESALEDTADEIKNSTASSESKTNTTESDSNNISSESNNDLSVGDQSTTQQYLISYNEGQWSPNNPSGKKQYDKVQLLKLREAKASRRQPEVSNVSILPTPNLMPSFIRNPKRVQSMVGSLSTNRGVAGSASGADGYGNKQASMSGVHGRGSMKGKNGMIHVNLSLHNDVKLNETENAWRPRVLVKGESEADPEAKTKREKEELVRRVRGILNKLTPEKFDALVEEIIKLKIDTPDKMEDVMVLVFEKAIDEPNFSVSYARLCHRLISEVKRRDERMESGTKTNLAQFRAALLDKTEREFTQNVTKSKAKEKKLQPIIEKIAKCTEPVEKAELEAQLEEEERKIRRRSGGTVRFIGELFKISMLTGKIINSCIDALLNPNSEDQLECLCKLLTTVGEKFEQTPVNTKESTRCYSLEKIMNRMQAIASKTDKDGAKVSSRVRFMLQDVIDLRRDKWQSKRNEAPKTMGQVEKEMKTEQLSSQYLNYAGSVSSGGGGGSNGPSSLGSSGKRDERGGGGRYNDSRSGYGGSHSQRGDTGSLRRQQQIGGNSGSNSGSGMHYNSNGDDSTWHVQTSKGGSRVLDPLKLEGLSTANNFDNKKMGGVGLFVWSNGSRQSSTPTSTPTNSFAALSSLSDTSRSNDRDRDRDRSGPRNKGSYNKGSMERDRYGMLPRSGSSQTSRESSSSRGPQHSRSALATSTIPKTSSHSKYTQQQMPSSNRMSTKLSGTGSSLYPQRGIDSYSHSNQADNSSSSGKPIEPPAAVFEKLNDEDILVIKSVVSDMVDIGSSYKTLRNSGESCILRVRENQRCALLSYIMTDYLHLRHIGKLQRRHLGNVVVYLIDSNFISVNHFNLAYKNFCEIASDLSLDIPDLWKYIIEFTGPLISRKLISIFDLWNKQLKEEDPSFGKKLLKIYLEYCLSQIGPNFTRTTWKKLNTKWTDFMEESDVQSFIQTNKFECIENDKIPPSIVVNESKEDYAGTVAESVEHLLKEELEAASIIDYINGNIVDIDKHFIRSLATKLCDFAISYKDNSYKLETDCFQKVCIPVLQRYIDSKEEFELECLYSMQLLAARLEHPRGLLSDLFGELYDADVIPQDSFLKWRDSKDQSAGKGVAVKGLNPFFTHILSSETSDENN